MTLSPFYEWHAEVPAKSGILLREEPMAEAPRTGATGEAVRILYTSEDYHWKSGQVPVSGILYLPEGDAPAGGWPLLAWAHGTVGIADVCAPSWTGHKDRDATYLTKWLEAGFAVVATDYQGLGGPGVHPYLEWQVEGRSILDSIRAARTARPGLISSQVVIAGQSQGGGAALGAAIIAASYAPDVDVLGIVATAPNSTFPEGPVSLPVRNSANMFLSFASTGLRPEAPAIENLLNDKGLQLLDTARKGCTSDLGKLAHKLKIRDLSEILSVSLEELTAMRIPVTDMPMVKTDIPFFIATGLADDTVAPLRQYAIAAALCTAGNTVTWSEYAGQDHDETMHGAFEDSLSFARARLAGQPASGNCGEISRPPSDAIAE
ncbi:MAG: lipase [Alphaproteobacteria bacterium]|nr:MAG: lipase [Alphaproteobacteria bacterium]